MECVPVCTIGTDFAGKSETGDALFVAGNFTGNKGSISSYWELFLWLLVLGMTASFYQIFAASFRSHQIADTGYYIFYVALMGILLKAFVSMQSIAAAFLEQMVLFIRLCIPAFCLCVGTATGGATATAAYGSALFFLFLVEKVMCSIFLPALEVYILLSVANGLWEEERLNTLLDQMKELLRGGMKWILGGVCGITFVRNAIQPAVDSLTGSAFQKVVASIPLLGNAAGYCMADHSGRRSIGQKRRWHRSGDFIAFPGNHTIMHDWRIYFDSKSRCNSLGTFSG